MTSELADIALHNMDALHKNSNAFFAGLLLPESLAGPSGMSFAK